MLGGYCLDRGQGELVGNRERELSSQHSQSP